MTIIDIVMLTVGLIFLIGPFAYIKWSSKAPEIQVGNIVTPKRDVTFVDGEKHSVGDEIVVTSETIVYFKSHTEDYTIIG